MLLWLVAVLVVAAGLWAVLRSTPDKNGGAIEEFFSSDDGAPIVRTPAEDKYAVNYTEPGRRVLVAFGTEYGFSETIAKKMVDRLKDLQAPPVLQPRLLNLRDAEAVDWAREEVVIFICSTTGDGVPPADSKPFFDTIEAGPSRWSHMRFATLALGDSAYAHYCRAGITLFQHAMDSGATALTPLVKVDQEDWPVIDRWIERVAGAIATTDLSVTDEYIDIASLRLAAQGPSRSNPYLSTLMTRRTLTQARLGEEPRDVFHAEFDLRGSGITYTSGDALGIFPENNPPEVARLLKALRCTGDETATVPSALAFYKQSGGRLGLPDRPTLRAVLTLCYDLKTVKADLLALLATKVTDSSNVKELNRILAQGMSLSTNAVLAEYVRSHEVADALLEFTSASVPVADVLDRMRALQPRYYSISSTPTEDPERCTATVAVVRYSLLGLPRTGVCTTYLEERIKVGERVPVFISRNAHFRLPADGSLPIIMIGPGTGIAPFRAFLRERVHTGATGRNILYFGCRRRDTDFLYADELQAFEHNGQVTLRVAFSREQAAKVYVQHLIMQDAKDIWATLEAGAHVYVCGDATHMAGDVHAALLKVIASCKGTNAADAAEYMERLEKTHRYQRDVWV